MPKQLLDGARMHISCVEVRRICVSEVVQPPLWQSSGSQDALERDEHFVRSQVATPRVGKYQIKVLTLHGPEAQFSRMDSLRLERLNGSLPKRNRPSAPFRAIALLRLFDILWDIAAHKRACTGQQAPESGEFAGATDQP